jgi:hypothetical protein
MMFSTPGGAPSTFVVDFTLVAHIPCGEPVETNRQ